MAVLTPAPISPALNPTGIKTSAYNAVASDFVVTNATAGTVPITMPTAPPDKTRIGGKMIATSGSNTTTYTCGGSDVFNIAAGATVFTLKILNQGVTFQYSSSTAIWYVTSDDLPLGQLDSRYAQLLGVAGGQTLDGGTAASDNLNLNSTSNATLGNINLNGTGTFVGPLGSLSIGESATTGAPLPSLKVTAPAHTALSATLDYNDILFDLSAVHQFATGAVPNVRSIYILPATYSAVGSSTINNAGTLNIGGPPIAGTNVTINNPYALRVLSGNSLFSGWIAAPTVYGGTGSAGALALTSTTNATLGVINLNGTTTFIGALGDYTIGQAASTGAPNSAFVIATPAHTSLTTGTEYTTVNITPATQTFAGTTTNALQRFMRIQAPTYSAAGTTTVTTAATLDISGPPIAGTNVTITNPYALRVNGGNLLVDSSGNLICRAINAIVSASAFSSITATGNIQVLSFGSIIGLNGGPSFTFPSPGTIVATPRVSSAIVMSIQGLASQSVPLTSFQQLDSTSVSQNCGYIDASYNTNTHASWSGILSLYAGDFNSSNLAKRLGLQIQSNGSVAQLGFFGTSPSSQPSGDVGSALVTLGLMTSPTYTSGNVRNTANVTNATSSLANLTDLSLTLTAGAKYVGHLTFFANNSTAAEGLQFDCGGGSATFTSFEYGFVATPIGTTLGTSTGTSNSTALSVTAATTGDSIYEIAITAVVNAGGTFIPRFSEVSHTLGTATVKLGSFMTLSPSTN